jgi:hypothetical protein
LYRDEIKEDYMVRGCNLNGKFEK